MPLATPDKVLPIAGSVLEGSSSVEHKILQKGRELQKATKDNWRQSLIEQARSIDNLQGPANRVENSFSVNTKNFYEDGTPEKGNAEKRLEDVKKLNTALVDLSQGFNSLDLGKQTKVLETLTPMFQRTTRWTKILETRPKANAEVVLKDMLIKGDVDIQTLQQEFKQSITGSQTEIDRAYQHMREKKEQLEEKAQKNQPLVIRQQEIDERLNEINDELNKYKKDGEYDRQIRDFEDRKDEISESLDNKTEVDALEAEIKALEYEQKRIEDKAGYAGIAQAVGSAMSGMVPGAGAVEKGAGAVGSNLQAQGYRLGIGQKRQNVVEMNLARKRAQKDQNKYDRRIREKKDLGQERKDLQEEHKRIEQAQKDLIEQGNQILSEYKREMGSLSTIEEGTINNLTAVAENALIRANNAIVEREAENWELGLTAIASDHRKLFKDTILEKCIKQSHERVTKSWKPYTGDLYDVLRKFHWRTKPTYDRREINKLCNAILDADGNNPVRLDTFIKTAIAKSGVPWDNVSEEQQQQMRAFLTVEGFRLRYEATGKLPNTIEQQILMSQPWSGELVKAGILKHPDFAQDLQTETGISAEDIKKGDSKALEDAREKIGTNQLLFFGMMGLSAIQFGSQLTKEEQPKQ